MLKAGFKDMLPANDTILLDKTKPDEFQFIVNKNANLVAMNQLTVMLYDTDMMIMLIDSTKTQRLAGWVGVETDRKALYEV